ncbi:MAG TPA: fluoride efflux transporter CrcB [Candidatus Didemnitutus sp.]|nr:fluoride efflux transporter CrcB [Candidatus Didemnitutus sp.]
MNAATLLWIALGGAAGSVVRALMSFALPSRFPWATLLINAAGSLLIGWLMARLGPLDSAEALRWRALMVTGFCGGFTTFSTFSWQTLEQALRGEWGAAIANVLLSTVLCLVAVWLGFRVARG